ncbi:MAG: maleylpyruvate isomerase family mycothiol-dependent enzyme [Propionibacteriaceae bacterium]|nr:maleylpyruvate isomerase family mycothiol-dependent enzyme [Propionibacteriaceae bacterium]
MTQHLAFPEVLEAIRNQTTRLLGATIEFSEDDWAAPTALPGWTKSHVAAHLVEQANRLARALGSSGEPSHPLPEHAQRLELEQLALDAGLALQIQLDESAGALQEVLPKLEDRDEEIQVTPQWRIRAAHIPVLRLRELLVHHYDLIGRTAFDVRQAVLLTVARFETLRPRREEVPPVLIVADEGFSARIGEDSGATTTVIGPLADLCLWLTRGVASENLSGTESVAIPLHA